MQIEETGPKLDGPEIERFEAAIGTPLPTDYRAFLLTHNGGYPVPGAFHFDDGRPGSSIHYFFQLKGKEPTVRLSYAIDMFRGRVPSNFLPIARDPFGNLVLLRMTEPGRGAVWFWDHELQPDVDEPPTMENMTRIAPSFEAMISGLYDPSA